MFSGVILPQTLINNKEALHLMLTRARATLMRPSALKQITESDESVAMWVTTIKCLENGDVVNNRVPARCYAPKLLKWYMERQVNRLLEGKVERNVSLRGLYHVAGKSQIIPCPELIEICSENGIILKPTCTDPDSLNKLRRRIRHKTADDLPEMWARYGIPLKETSYVLVQGFLIFLEPCSDWSHKDL